MVTLSCYDASLYFISMLSTPSGTLRSFPTWAKAGPAAKAEASGGNALLCQKLAVQHVDRFSPSSERASSAQYRLMQTCWHREGRI
mmetsp:Transcript_38910/g.100932  ORF Transcript_38910/g.100932 Transcript_38910/m.100932 type:complete len:86 (+) Transcript_38910:148-405(+)